MSFLVFSPSPGMLELRIQGTLSAGMVEVAGGEQNIMGHVYDDAFENHFIISADDASMYLTRFRLHLPPEGITMIHHVTRICSRVEPLVLYAEQALTNILSSWQTLSRTQSIRRASLQRLYRDKDASADCKDLLMLLICGHCSPLLWEWLTSAVGARVSFCAFARPAVLAAK